MMNQPTLSIVFTAVGLLIGGLSLWIVMHLRLSKSQNAATQESSEFKAKISSNEERLKERDTALGEMKRQLEDSLLAKESLRNQMNDDFRRLQYETNVAIEQKAKFEGELVGMNQLTIQLKANEEKNTEINNQLALARESLSETMARLESSEIGAKETLTERDKTYALIIGEKEENLVRHAKERNQSESDMKVNHDLTIKAITKAHEDAMRTRDDNVRMMLSEKDAAFTSQLDEKQKSIEEQKLILRQAENTLKDTFKALSSDALKEANESFTKTAEEKFGKSQEDSIRAFAVKQEAIEQMLKPFKETLDGLNKHHQEIETKREVAYSEVSRQVDSLMKETNHLSNALKRPTVRGNWGEMTLRTVAENAGLLEGSGFVIQHTTQTDNGQLRADMIVSMPHGRKLVIDSKAPFDAYREAANEDNPEIRNQHLNRHASNLKTHIRQLSEKEYWGQYEGTEYVVLFLPTEAIYQAAMEVDAGLMEFAIKKKVLIASPITLVSLLKTVYYVHSLEKLNQQASEVGKLGSELYDAVRIFSGHMSKLGKNLGQSVSSYNQCLGSIETRLFVKAKRLKETGVGTSEEVTDVESIESIPSTFKKPELLQSPQFSEMAMDELLVDEAA